MDGKVIFSDLKISLLGECVLFSGGVWECKYVSNECFILGWSILF